MEIVKTINLKKYYKMDNYTVKAVDNINLNINNHEFIAIVGSSGSGKSTLLKIVAGLEEPDEGTVVKGRNLYIRYLPQNPEFEPGRTVLDCVIRENMAHEHAWDLEGDAKSMLNKLGITDYSAKVETLSGGQRKRVALAAVLLSTADLLILDEPTNHLDSAMADWLEEYLKKFRGALLMITHDRYFLDNVTNRIVELDKGKLYSYQSGYEGYLELKAEREAMAVSSEQKRQNILRTELAWIRRGAQARSTKQKGRIQRFEALSAVEAPKVDGNVEMSSISSRLGRTTVEAHHLHKAYGDRLLIDDFSYIFLKDDRIGIIGPNGSGKSTLMKMITGWVKPDSGETIIGQTVKMGYFSQENEDMDQSMRVIDYIKNVAEYVRTADGLVSASQMLERFLFPSHMQYTLIGKLSGGERRRLYLLHILMGAPNVLLLDEPTNDLDIGTLTILEDYLDHFQGIVITVSHDRYFLDRVVRRIFAFEGGGSIRQYEGGYTDYQAACGERIAAEMEESGQEHGRGQKTGGASGAGTSDAAETAKDKNRGRQREKKLKFSYMEQKEWETIEDDIAALEEAIADLEQQMQDSARDYTALNGIIKEKEEKEEPKKEETAAAPAAPKEAKKEDAKKSTVLQQAKKAAAANNKAVSHTVRVDIDKLDVLMNLVSELIIAKNGLVSASISEEGAATANNQKFTEQIEYLERVTTNLHESVMKVRMMPIEGVISKFPRMIRDLNKKLNKKMELYITGEETELDRTVLDEIGDPIMHLLRNSADHGLESAEVRAERGKPEVGSIYLNAFQEGNNVVIEVADDGNGIDVEKVKSKAVEKGTLTQEQADALTEKEAVDLLFKPSFSTSDKITDVSGRGVGLDVVKSKIEALGGDVEVKTKYGEGSTFSIRLPLTLAIIQALMVKLGDEKYAISLGSIETIEDVPVSDIKYVHAKEVINLRGSVIPLIRLRDVLDIPGEAEESDTIIVVIVRKGDKLAGLVVDSLIGQMEIVIKSLGKYININRMISGATILGDGSVALIIDANTLV